MKKLIAVALLLMIATPVFALNSVVGSKHDVSGGTEEVCVFCHTPHGAIDAANAPLWNRTNVPTIVGNYNTTTFSQAAAVSYNGTDVLLCISCHDGSAMNAVANAPNVGGALTATPAVVPAGNGLIGTNLSNDHPVGFVYATAATADGANNLHATPLNYTPTWGAGGTMQCSSCHDVHDNSNGIFLARNNTNSNMCVSCHNK